MLNRILVPTGTKQTAVITALALLLAASALLVFLQSPATAQGNDKATSNLAVSSPNPGELVITWDAPGDAPDDYRVTWKKSDGRWHSYKHANTVEGGNAFPTGTSHTVTSLEEGTAYQARVRARYHDDNGDLEKSGPWSDAGEITISATPSQDGEGDSNEGPPAKPTGLITAASHDNILLTWDNPDDDTITGYQVLHGPDADNLAVLADDTGDANTSYTDSTVEAETTYVYAVRGRNAEGLGPQSDPVSVTTPAAPPAKPTGLLTGARHDSVLLAWDNPDDDSITGYQVLRGPDADNLTVLTDDTGSATSSYTDDTVEAETTYVYAVRGRNARGLGQQSDPVTLTTSAAPEEDDPPTSARALAGEDFTLAGQDLDTGDSNCLEDTIGDVTAACTINIDTTTAIFAVDGTLDSDDRLNIKIGRDKAAVDAASNAIDASDLVGADAEATLTFQVGRNLMRLWGDEDGSGGSSSEEHFYRVNVLPYWELNGDRLSKSDDCRAATDRTAAEITDDDCIVTQFGNTAELQFHNVISDQFNVYVHVNGTQVITEPGNTDLAGPFDLDLQDGDNAVRVRLASKTGTHFAESYSTDKFHYKVKATDVLVSNLGQTVSAGGSTISALSHDGVAVQFTTGGEPGGYTISKVRLSLRMASGTTPEVSIYSDSSGQPGSSLKILTNPGTIPTSFRQTDFDADNYQVVADTSYWVVIKRGSGSADISVQTTDSTSEDTGSAAGWSIGNDTATLGIHTGTWSTAAVAMARIAVKGEVVVKSSDATLSALALTDANNNAVALDPTFASATTSYNATVASSVLRIKVEPTANDSNAAIEYLDDSDATLTDEDTSTAEFDFDLSEGSNVVKVKVTAEDGATTKTYTVRIRRAEADLLVSNLGQPLGTYTIDVAYPGVAVQFTTGNETNGYSISQVRLDIAAVSGTIPKVSIYSDRSGQPGSSLKVLTNPGAIPTTITELDFGADDYKVDPSTPYWIVVERASGTGFVYIRATRYTAEDTGSAAGWSIINNGSRPSGATWSTITGFIAIPGIAVKGTVAQPASTDATLSALALKDASNNAVALSPTFASATTSYNATVANSVSQIKVEPTATDGNADIEYLDDSDTTLPDYDTSTAVFDFDLNVGSNVVKVEVTAEDSSTTETYTITVTRQAAAAPASTDATLSALALFDFNSDGVTLSPAFAADVTSYTAAVANAHTHGELEATPNDSNATVEFLDENDATITTVTQTGNVHSILPDFEVGENVFKVKVTAGDGTTTRTYTITVTRVDFLVSNLGQTEGGTWKLNTAGAGTAVQFMTGGNTLGYNISKVRLKLGSPSGIEPRVIIYSDNSGRPGSILKVLINPPVIPTSRSVIEFDAEDYALDAGTTYWVALERGPGTDHVIVSYANSTDEDPGSAADWSTGNTLALKSGGVWIASTFGPIQVAILGTADTTPNHPPTGSPTISGQAEVGHTLTAVTSAIADSNGLNDPGFTYQWQREDGGVFTDISGATGMLYRLTSEDEDKRVRVGVTFTDDDGNSHSLSSPPTGTVQPLTSIPSDKVEVSLGQTAYTVDEGDTLQVTVTLKEAPEDGRVIIPFTLTPADGATKADFRTKSSYFRLLRFDAGETKDQIYITAVDDTLDDDGENLALCLGELPEPYAVLVGRDCTTINIVDNDDPNSVEIYFHNANYNAHEDGSPVTVLVAMDPVPDREITIPITFTRNGGLSAADHSPVTTSVTFGPEVHRYHNIPAYREIEIWAIDDSEDDDGEYMDITFGNVSDPYVSERTGTNPCCSQIPGTVRPYSETRVWFEDNEFTQVPVSNPRKPEFDDSLSMIVTFSADTYDAHEDGAAATVSVWLLRHFDREREVTIPINVERMGGATRADTISTYTSIPSTITFKPGQTAQTFRVAASDDSVDDDGEWLKLSFGELPERVSEGVESTCHYGACAHNTARVNLLDNDDPPVQVSFAQSNYAAAITERTKYSVYATLDVTVKLSAVPERFVDAGIVAESIRGDGDISFRYAAYIPREPYVGATFYADETAFTVTVVMKALGEEFDANQAYRLRFVGMSDRVSVGTPATATITINANP